MANRTLCLSHSSDVDGLASAALVKMATNADILLADYGNLLSRLTEVADVDTLYICDLGLSPGTQGEFLKQILRIQAFASISYIDHHPFPASTKNKILATGMKIRHSTRECSSVLTYLEFRKRLSQTAGLLAAYGAVTDYRDDGPIAQKIIEGFDRQFVLFESTLLSHAIARRGDDDVFLLDLVEALSHLQHPHQINDVLRYAEEQADVMADLLVKVKKDGIKRKSFAYIHTDRLSAGNVANLLIGAFDVPVGVAYKSEGKDGFFEVSLRGTKRCHKHLGSLVSFLASKLGGFGGGHAKASGARIPESRLEDFLTLLDRELKS